MKLKSWIKLVEIKIGFWISYKLQSAFYPINPTSPSLSHRPTCKVDGCFNIKTRPHGDSQLTQFLLEVYYVTHIVCTGRSVTQINTVQWAKNNRNLPPIWFKCFWKNQFHQKRWIKFSYIETTKKLKEIKDIPSLEQTQFYMTCFSHSFCHYLYDLERKNHDSIWNRIITFHKDYWYIFCTPETY